MKRIILILVSSFYLVNGYTSQAQSYIPFPDSGATWVNTYHHIIGPPPFPLPQLINVEYYCANGEDTLINSISYTKVNYCDSSFAAGIRDDGNGKVFVIPKDSLNEFILYDFSANPGDTIKNVYCKFGAYCWNGLVDYRIISLDSVLIGNSFRKRLHNDFGGVWIEGIGNSQGLFWEAGVNVSMYSVELHCFSLLDTIFYSNGNYSPIPIPSSCSFDVGLEEIGKHDIWLFPNPATKVTYLTIDNDDSKLVELFDITGKLIYSLTSNQSNISIAMENFEPGIYFIKVTIDGYSSTKKLVKY